MRIIILNIKSQEEGLSATKATFPLITGPSFDFVQASEASFLLYFVSIHDIFGSQ